MIDLKLDRVSQIPYSSRVGRYHFQMVQAKLSSPVEPIFGYSLQPYYTRQQQWMTDLSDSLSRLYRFFADLDQAAQEFDPARPESAINQRTVVSSQPEAAAVKPGPRATNGTHRLSIGSLASGQTNTGTALPGDFPTLVTEGPQQFSLQFGEQEELFAYYSHGKDTHADSLRSVAEALRNSSLPVDVRQKSEGQYVALSVSSRKTGAGESFELQDVSGNTIRVLGLDRATTSAADAVFVWNGRRDSSPSNHVWLTNDAVQVSMLQTTATDIVIEVAPDYDRLLQKTHAFVNRYNQLHDFLTEQASALSSQKLDPFAHITRASRGTLDRYGLGFRKDGSLSFDEQVWREATSAHVSGFIDEMARLSRAIREEVVKVQSKPFGSFSQAYAAATSANPYHNTSASGMNYRYVAQTGLFLNQLW
ncbi:MAG: flagellar filament capping protein FliD [Bacillota bacterium]